MTPDRPLLRSDLTFSTVKGDAEPQVLVYDPVLNRYHQLGAIQELILKKLDGQRSLRDIIVELARELDAELPLDVLRAFVEQARSLYLLDAASTTPFTPAEGRRARKRVHRELAQSGFALRGSPRPSAPAPERRARHDVAQLFELAVGQLNRGNPIQAVRHLYAVMELAPDNARAAYLLRCVQKAALLARRPGESALSSRIPFGNPDRLLGWLVKRIGFLVSPWFYGLLVLWFVAGAVLLGSNLDRVVYDVGQVPTAVRNHPFLVLGGYLWFPLIAIGHEFCHGLACKKWGGRVPEIGLLFFLYLFPTAYCDTSATYTFSQTWRRVGVSLAGISWQMLWYLPAVLVYVNTPGGSVTHVLALFLLLSCWGSVLSGMIPFVRSDGYYALSDALRTPNLFQISNAFWRDRLGAWVLGLSRPQASEASDGGAGPFVLATYGALNITSLVLFSISAYFAVTLPLMTTLLRGPGLLIASIPLLLLVGRPALRLLATLVRRRAEVIRSARAWVSLCVVVGGLAFAAAVPVPYTVTVPFEVGGTAAVLEAPSSGVLAEWRVREGDEVEAGAVLGRLEQGQLAVEVARAQTALSYAQADLAVLTAGPSAERLRSLAGVLKATRDVEAVATRRLARAEVLMAQGLAGAPAREAGELLQERARGLADQASGELAALGTRPFEAEVKARTEAVRAAQTELELAKHRLEALVLRAPRAGRVTWSAVSSREVSPAGRAVTKGEPLVRLAATPWVAELATPVEYSAMFAQGQRVLLRFEGVDGAPVEVRLGVTGVGAVDETKQAIATTGLGAMLAGGTRAVAARDLLHLKTTALPPGPLREGAMGRARIEVAPRTLLWRAGWQVAYFAGYYWWSLW